MSIAEIAAVSTLPPSKYWLRYISCHSAPMRMRVLADEELAVVLHRAGDRQLAPESPASPQP